LSEAERGARAARAKGLTDTSITIYPMQVVTFALNF